MQCRSLVPSHLTGEGPCGLIITWKMGTSVTETRGQARSHLKVRRSRLGL